MLWTPKPYQPIIRDFIIDTPRCNIWADPGLGKSVSTLTALDILWLAGSRYHPVLVIAPKRVARDVWSRETAKWDHLQGLKVSRIIGTPQERIIAAMTKADVYTTNYENLPWLVDFYKRKWPFKIVVADESTKLKGFRLKQGGKRTRALSMVAKYTGRWINLSGTPLPQGPVDAWGQCWFLDYGKRLGRTFTAFEQRWFTKFEFTRTPLPHAQEQIMEAIGDVTISLRFKDWFDVEDPIQVPVYFDLPAKARSVYDQMEQDLFAHLDEDTSVEAFTTAARSMKCCQIANGAIYTDDKGSWQEVHDAKIKLIADIEDETDGQPLLIAYWFKHDLERLRKAYPDARVYESEQDGLDWNTGKIGKMFVHPDRAGHGLDFQDGGCILVMFSQTWNLELRQQIIERIGPVRQFQAGHPRNVFVYDLLARNTTDEIMNGRIGQKATVQDAMRAYRDRKRAA